MTVRSIPQKLWGTSFALATDAWRQAIGDCQVLHDTTKYRADTSSFTAQIPLALRPVCAEQVPRIVRIAQQFSVPIYPISTGRNWGYGTSVPPQSPAVILDLSLLNRIVKFNDELGVVTLEPGVTQGQLSKYLQAISAPFMVPVTGGGPDCSVIANALERGFGITPITDHFGAVISMKVVLPNGEIYESYSRAFDAAGVASAYKWSTGPYADGLFSQSNFGIVIDASIALQPRAERTGALVFVMDTNEQVDEATREIRRLLIEAGHNVGAINIMSRNRVECMLSGARKISAAAQFKGRVSMPAGAWFGFGSVYGSKEHYSATCRLIQRCLRRHGRQIRVYTRADIKRLRRLSSLAAAFGWPQFSDRLDRLDAAFDIVDGIPSIVALPLAYAKSGRPGEESVLNPAADGCGLFWYAPIVPMQRGVVIRFVQFVESVCAKYDLQAPMTLTALSPRYYAATVALLFDRTGPDAEFRARACFERLYREGLALGFMPYRLGSQFMPALAGNRCAAAPLLKAIKCALDPNQVLAPGRYSFT